MKLTKTEEKILKNLREKEAERNRNQTVYFIADSSKTMVKIGITGRTVEERLMDLQPYNHSKLIILKTIKGTFNTERRLHQKFQEYSSHNEWFFVEGALKQYLKNVL